MHLAPLIHDLAVICAVAGVVTLIFQRIQQPVVLGYIIAGIVIGPHTPPKPFVSDLATIRTLAELGVIFLMFTLGLEFSFRRLAKAGGAAGLATLIEVIFMAGIGYGASKILGRSNEDSFFLAGCLAISSTTIILKALGELGLQHRRFAEFVFSILIVEDLIAILLLAAVSEFAANGSFSISSVAQSLGQLILVVGAWILVGYFIVPKIVLHAGAARSEETLIILSVGLCLGLVVMATGHGYSPALGAFIMGSIIAESNESQRIKRLMHPVRDLFGAIFFVSIGMLLDPTVLLERAGEVILLSLLVVIGKTIGVTLGALVAGQTLKRSVLIGSTLTQIGEFSFILAGLGSSLGLISDSLYAVAVAVSLVTTLTTPYCIRFGPRLAEYVESRIPAGLHLLLEAYHGGFEKIRGRAWSRDPKLAIHLRRWVVSTFIVTLTAMVSSRAVVPWLQRTGATPSHAQIIAWACGLLLASPFLWSMLTAFRGRIAPVMQLISLLIFLVLSLSFFSTYLVIGVLFIPLLLVFSRVYRALESSYHWFEEGFLATFRKEEKEPRAQEEIHLRLAPWNSHLVRIKVHADSKFSGKKLSESQLRSRHGLNVVVIQRGSRLLIAPSSDETLFPKDELLVLGTDECIDEVRSQIEMPDLGGSDQTTTEGFALRQLVVEPGSIFSGVSIRDTQLRDKYRAMIVGIERAGRKIMNPESEEIIQTLDVLWLVGESQILDALANQVRNFTEWDHPISSKWDHFVRVLRGVGNADYFCAPSLSSFLAVRAR